VKATIKWLSILVGGLVLLIILALLVIPRFVNIQRFKPLIEERVSEATGRPFTLGGNLSLSLFPWAGFSASDVHLENPPGFDEKDIATVKSCELRVKLMPLLLKDVQVKRFIVDTPRVVLERSKDGRGNWEGIGRPSEQIPSEGEADKRKAPQRGILEGLPIKSLAVGEFAIKNASLLWIDRVDGDRKEVSDVTLRLEDISFDRAIRIALSGKMGGQALSLEGKVGPLGRELGTGTTPLNLAIKATRELDMNVAGTLVDPATRPQFDLAFETDPFSPKKLLAALGQAFSVETTDPDALNAVAFKARLRGNLQKKEISISDGLLNVDDSKLTFSAKATDYSLKPHVTFGMDLDQIDLGRYLPPTADKEARDVDKKAESRTPKRADYTPLRKLVLDGGIHIGKLKAYGASIEDLNLKVAGKDGEFRLEPLTLELYEGNVSAKGSVDLREGVPKTQLALDAGGIQAGPLVRDVLRQDFLEGDVKAKVTVAMAGDDPERIKQTLNGEGDFLFKDGAIKGIDLASMVRNVKAAFGLAETAGEGPRTDFSELHAPFTIANGVLTTPKTTLISPALRVSVVGEADLVTEVLNFRVEPKFVGTITGQGDTVERSGIMVPVLVTGSFAAPKFRPDLGGIIRKELEERLPQASEWIKSLPDKTKEGDNSGSLEEKAKDLLKQIPFGR
jgi:AsmA protein